MFDNWLEARPYGGINDPWGLASARMAPRSNHPGKCAPEQSAETPMVPDPDDTILREGEIGNATFAVIVPKDANHGMRQGMALCLAA
jgi:hypothetical protein